MSDEAMVCLACECGASNYIFLGRPDDLTRMDDYAFECWSCKKNQLINAAETTRDILVLEPDEDVLEAAVNEGVAEGHRSPKFDDWVDEFLDKPCTDENGDESTVRAGGLSGLNDIMRLKTPERKKWFVEFLSKGGGAWGFGSLYETLEKALLDEKTVLQGDDESHKLSVIRHVEEAMLRLLYLEGVP